MHGRLFSQGQAAATELLRGELESELSNRRTTNTQLTHVILYTRRLSKANRPLTEQHTARFFLLLDFRFNRLKILVIRGSVLVGSYLRLDFAFSS